MKLIYIINVVLLLCCTAILMQNHSLKHRLDAQAATISRARNLIQTADAQMLNFRHLYWAKVDEVEELKRTIYERKSSIR
jgi:uncharacterized membrane protein